MPRRWGAKPPNRSISSANAPAANGRRKLGNDPCERAFHLSLLRVPFARSHSLVEEQGMTYMADIGPNSPLRSLQAASCTYRIAFGPRAGQKVVTLRTVVGRDEKTAPALCAEAHGFSLHAECAVVCI